MSMYEEPSTTGARGGLKWQCVANYIIILSLTDRSYW